MSLNELRPREVLERNDRESPLSLDNDVDCGTSNVGFFVLSMPSELFTDFLLR